MKSDILAFMEGGRIRGIVTSVTLVNNTAKTVNTDVPSGKRWKLLAIRQTNVDDVDRFCSVVLLDPSNTLLNLVQSTLTASGGDHQWPNTTADIDISTNMPDLWLKPDWRLQAYWGAGGASAGGTDADGLVFIVLEVDV